MSTITQLTKALCCLLVCYCPAALQATTIIPFKNLGELAQQADAVVRARAVRSFEHQVNETTFFRTKFVVLDHIKGELQVGKDFEVQKWERVIDDKRMTMWGDLDLYDGSTYLLFLEERESGLYRPLCFSYYLFEEITMEGNEYFVPSKHAHEFELMHANGAEPLKVYRRSGLMQELSAVVHTQKVWDSKSFASSMGHEDFFGHQHQRSEPSHCQYLSSNNRYFRWKDFDVQSVALHYSASGQIGCAQANTLAQQCVSELNAAYPGVNLVDGGTVNFSPTCTYGSALGSEYRNWISSNLGGSRHVVIQYDDPCGEISDLSGCSGVLAIGGLYGVGSHTFNGDTWYSGGYGYVIINNGVGTCKCNDMGDILTHEVTHSLGLGHILSGHGSANMNPSCCNNISTLDESCVSFAYDELAALPMELVSFEGEAKYLINQITWSTAWEANVDKYEVQKATELTKEFVTIAEVHSQGDTEFGHDYTFEDINPASTTYYRLLSIDRDGSQDQSKIVSVKRERLAGPLVYPSQTREVVNVRIPEGEQADLKIRSTSGILHKSENLKESYTKLDVANLPAGWYYLQVANVHYSETFKIFKTD